MKNAYKLVRKCYTPILQRRLGVHQLQWDYPYKFGVRKTVVHPVQQILKPLEEFFAGEY